MLLIAFGGILDLRQSYYWALLLAASLFVYQQMLIQGRQREQCFKAFLNNNYVGMVIFIGISLSVLWQ